ncbi:uncharacterized protein BX663DRAFT_520217 [Cokeromyces recurvatus]|uniref:uncharacterized protein n=1 Tax=Cokeromyces recurvatus TaxID=90255 RepID=UPI00221FB6FC|nr:uncharacterized protein BX663DRAFT_520217 [Cokeromyces recurvatus]KAI7899725.1 hypothetical protein BX663DRAFT_520217 [Cokeromyces recurvatus]
MIKTLKFLPSLISTKKPSNNGKKKLKSSLNEYKEDKITKLPRELLVCIYQQLRTQECIKQFSLTCRTFYHIAVHPRSKAAWIITHFGPRFALYYALLTVPKLCYSQWVNILFHMGAIVPRHVLQALVQVYGKGHTSLHKNPYTTDKSSLSPLNCDDEIMNCIFEGKFFSNQIQHIPFDGYVTILQKGYQDSPELDLQTNDVAIFMSSISSTCSSSNSMNNRHDFFPAPLIEKTMQHGASMMTLKLLSLNNTIQPFETVIGLFEFDPVARASLWEAIVLILFNEAFKSNSSIELSRDRQYQLKMALQCLNLPYESDIKEETLFCHVLSHFFIKYPVGYCHQGVMNKLLGMLKFYLRNLFDLDTALRWIVNQRLGRSDIIESIDHFLKHEPYIHTHTHFLL